MAYAYLKCLNHLVEYFKSLHGGDVMLRRFAPSQLIKYGLKNKYVDLIQAQKGKNAADIRLVIFLLTKVELSAITQLAILAAYSDFSPLLEYTKKYPNLTVKQYTRLPKAVKKRLYQETPQTVVPALLHRHLLNMVAE